MRRAFTLIELISVCVILGVLGSLMMPVAFQAIRAARVSSNISRLKQLHLAFALYQSEWEGEGRYGTSSQMGLPDNDAFYRHAWQSVAKEEAMWKTACGLHPGFDPNKGRTFQTVVEYIYPACDKQAGCGDYYSRYQDQSILLYDVNCTDPSTPLESPFHEKTIVGVRLNGQAETIRTHNDPYGVDNWHDR